MFLLIAIAPAVAVLNDPWIVAFLIVAFLIVPLLIFAMSPFRLFVKDIGFCVVIVRLVIVAGCLIYSRRCVCVVIVWLCPFSVPVNSVKSGCCLVRVMLFLRWIVSFFEQFRSSCSVVTVTIDSLVVCVCVVMVFVGVL